MDWHFYCAWLAITSGATFLLYGLDKTWPKVGSWRVLESALHMLALLDVTCQGSVPESIIAFLDSEDYESSVRNAVSLGGDSDTPACIARRYCPSLL
jgi:hypothetical protein